MFHVFTHRTQRTLFFHVFTHHAQRTLFVSCVHKPHSKDFVCCICSHTVLKGLGFVSCVHKPRLCLFHLFIHRTQMTLFVLCVHPPHSKDFVCVICSQTALKGLGLFDLFTHGAPRTLFVLFVHPPRRTKGKNCTSNQTAGLHLATHSSSHAASVYLTGKTPRCEKVHHSRGCTVKSCVRSTTGIRQW